MAISSLLSQRSSLFRAIPVFSPDNDQQAWELIADNIPCRLDKAITTQYKLNLGLNIATDAVLYLAKAEIDATNQPKVGDRIKLGEQLYTIVALHESAKQSIPDMAELRGIKEP